MRQALHFGPLAAAALVFSSYPAHADDVPAPPPPSAEEATVSSTDAPAPAGVSSEAPAPAGDWAVLHAGIRPRLATFGGIGTLAVAQGRVHHFYGLTSFA